MIENLDPKILTFKYVIFDMDGTLLNSEPRHADAWNSVVMKYGIPKITYEYLGSVGGISTYNICKMLCEQHGVKEDYRKIADEKIKAYREVFMHQAECFPSMVELVKTLHEQGTTLAVATGSMLPETQVLLNKFGITPFLKAIVSTEQVEHGKPSPDIYLEAAKRMGCTNPLECLVFEDTPIGFRGVKAANMNLVKVKEGKLLTQVLSPSENDAVL